MKRLLLTAIPLLLTTAAFAQPDPNANGMGKNPPEAAMVARPQFTQDTPENAVRFFFNALTDQWELRMPMAVAGARVGFYGANEWETMRRNIYPINSLSQLRIDNIEVETPAENEALASITAHLDYPGLVGQPKTTKYTLPLRLETNLARPGFEPGQKVWRVVPLSVEEVLAKPSYELPPLQFAATLALRDARLLPYLRQQTGMSQLKQLSLGALQFNQDYDEVMAFDDAARERALRPYLKNDALFLIPGTKDEKFHFNENLSDKGTAAVAEPARTVLFYDGTEPQPDALNFRFGDKTLIAFLDGHVKAFTKDGLNDLIWKP